MNRRNAVRSLALCALGGGLLAVLAPAHPPRLRGGEPIEFGELSLILETNAVDNDAEIVLSLDADLGLKSLKVKGPAGKKVLTLSAKGSTSLGQRKIDLETPEPTPAEVLAAYPEGVYQFFGVGVDGERLFGEVTLSHALPGATAVTSPASGATDVPLTGVTATWTAVPGAARYVVEIEEEDSEVNALRVDVPSTSTSLVVPDGWLVAGTAYQIGVAVVGTNGNVTVYEHTFQTVP